MWPFTVEDANAWWGGVIESVAADRTLLFGAYLDGALVGTVQLGLDVPPNQPHIAADVKKLLVHRRRARPRHSARPDDALESEARRRGLSLLTLDTASGSAERLYRAPRLDEVRHHPELRALARRAPLRDDDLLEGLGLNVSRSDGGGVLRA